MRAVNNRLVVSKCLSLFTISGHCATKLTSYRGLEGALKRISKQTMQYEYQMKDLEVCALCFSVRMTIYKFLYIKAKLSENLSNFRALDSLLQEAFSGLQVRRHLESVRLDICNLVRSEARDGPSVPSTPRFRRFLAN
jgi:hypothetical protein